MFKNNKTAQAVRLALIASVATTAFAMPAYAADADIEAKVKETAKKDAAKKDEKVERIAVTGSRIMRTDLEPTQPMTVIDSDYISERGITNPVTAIADIPGVFQGTSPEVDGAASTGQAVGQNTISLYSLGSQRTLTLINGSRFVSSNSPISGGGADGSQVDVNNIPVAMIDRVEIVKVGGAPVYGADAVSGVVNYVLKKDYEGAEFSVDHRSYGSYADETSIRGLLGGNFAEDKGNLVFSFEYNKTDDIPSKDVKAYRENWGNFTPTTEDRVLRENGEVVNGQTRLYPNSIAGILSFSGLVTPGSRAITNLGVGKWGDAGFLHFDPSGSGKLVPFDPGTPTGNAVWGSGGDGLDLVETSTALEGYERYNMSIFGNYELADWLNFSVTAFANSSDAANQGYQASSYSSGLFGTEVSGGSLLFNTDHPFLSSSAKNTLEDAAGGPTDFYLQRGWINIGQRLTINESSVRSLRLAFDGEFEIGDNLWNWEVSYQEGTSSVYSKSNGTSDHRFIAAMDVGINPDTGLVDCKYNYVDGYADALFAQGNGLKAVENVLGAPGDCKAFNPFGTASQESLDYLTYNDLAHSRVEQDIFTAYASGQVAELPAGSLDVAVGFEHRKEFARYTSDGTGELTGFVDSSTQGQYTTKDVFVEMHVPIFSDDMDIPMLHKLNLETSFRSIDNDRAGKDDVWAVGLNYQPISDIVIKANIGETVRAPAIGELFQPRLIGSSFATDPCDADNLGKGPNPAVRQANCAAEGIPADFAGLAKNASVSGLSGGNPNLNNERADTKNVGFLYAPSWAEGLTFAADWISIDIEDAIVSYTLTELMEACYDGGDYPNDFCGRFTRQANFQLANNKAYETGVVNAAFKNFEAYEYTIAYQQELAKYPLIGGLLPADSGELGLRLRAYNLKKNETSNTGFDFNDTTGQFNNPEWRGDLTISHNINDLSTFIDVRHQQGGARNIESTEPLQYIDQNGKPYTTLPSVTTFDIGMSYHITDNINVRARIENAGDWYPNAKELAAGRWTWGRVYNVGISAKF